MKKKQYELIYTTSLMVHPKHTHLKVKESLSLLKEYIYDEVLTTGKVKLEGLFSMTMDTRNVNVEFGGNKRRDILTVKSKLMTSLKVAKRDGNADWLPRRTMNVALKEFLAERFEGDDLKEAELSIRATLRGLARAAVRDDFIWVGVISIRSKMRYAFGDPEPVYSTTSRPADALKKHCIS